MDICVILPCAGEGSRLGLPFPKELAPLGEDRVVIDSCLGMIYATRDSPRILLLEDGRREQTAQHIRGRLPGIPLACIRQDVNAGDMPEAVQMLGPWLAEINILLLPDAVYDYDGDPVAEIAAQVAASGRCFGAVKAPWRDLLHLGALATAGDQATAYEDKPSFTEPYDSAWVALGFSGGNRGKRMLDVIRSSTARQFSCITVLDPPVPVVWLKGFRDCGTWDSYRAEFNAIRN